MRSLLLFLLLLPGRAMPAVIVHTLQGDELAGEIVAVGEKTLTLRKADSTLRDVPLYFVAALEVDGDLRGGPFQKPDLEALVASLPPGDAAARADTARAPAPVRAATPRKHALPPPSFLVFTEPVKWVPAFLGQKTFRAYLAYIKGRRMHVVKFSTWLIDHEVEAYPGGERETPERQWVRLGYGFRPLNRFAGSGPFMEFDANLIYFNYSESIFERNTIGVMPMAYFGAQYLGERLYASIAIGGGIIAGGVNTDSRADADNEAPPDPITYPPLTLQFPFTHDLDFSLGFRF